MNITELYKEAYQAKEANLPAIAKAGALLGTNAGLYAAFGIPALSGILAALIASKITDPTDTDLSNYEKEAYTNELQARVDRLKKLPKAQYNESENTLRI